MSSALRATRSGQGGMLQKETDQSWVPGAGVRLVASSRKGVPQRGADSPRRWDAFFGKADGAAEQAEILASAAIRQVAGRTEESVWRPAYVTAAQPDNRHVSLCCFILVAGTLDLSHWLLKQDLGNCLLSHMHEQGPCDYFYHIRLGSPRRRCQNGIRWARGLLGKMPVREKGKGTRGRWESRWTTVKVWPVWGREGTKLYGWRLCLPCSQRRVPSGHQGVPKPMLPIREALRLAEMGLHLWPCVLTL